MATTEEIHSSTRMEGYIDTAVELGLQYGPKLVLALGYL